jgi:FMN phosphatase YigB (HAD superfamily)
MRRVETGVDSETRRRSRSIELRRPRAVLFDIGDTILEERRFDLEAGIGAVVSDTKQVELLAEAFRADLLACHQQRRELLLAQWLCERVPSLACHAVADIEDAIWTAVVTLVPRPLIHTVFDRLSQDGLPLAAISNAAFSSRVLSAELARHGLASTLRFVLSSADVGWRKPALIIFETAIARLEVPADTVWFIGDTVDEDILGASAAGLQPFWFSPALSDDTVMAGVPIVRDWADFLAVYETERARSSG